jgi:hypothetical protein
MRRMYSSNEAATRALVKQLARVELEAKFKAELAWYFPGAKVIEILGRMQKSKPPCDVEVRILLDHPHYSLIVEGVGPTVFMAALMALRTFDAPLKTDRHRPPVDEIPF